MTNRVFIEHDLLNSDAYSDSFDVLVGEGRQYVGHFTRLKPDTIQPGVLLAHNVPLGTKAVEAMDFNDYCAEVTQYLETLNDFSTLARTIVEVVDREIEG